MMNEQAFFHILSDFDDKTVTVPAKTVDDHTPFS
jgi:hypothetical protein